MTSSSSAGRADSRPLQLAYIEDADGKDLGVAVVELADDGENARLVGFIENESP